MGHSFFMPGSSLGVASFCSLTRRSRAGAPYQSVRPSIAHNRCDFGRMERLSQRPLVEWTSTPANSRSRHDAEVCGGPADPRPLLRDIGSEVGRPAEIGDLPGEVQPFLDRRINGLANIRGNAFANSLGHGRRAEKADKA